LMPRPPAEYIQETQEEDARVRDSVAGHDIALLSGNKARPKLDLRPSTLGINGISVPGPPPPLP